MPIYEYRCQKCKKEFELLVSANDRKKRMACPYCGSRKAQRLISNFAFSSGGVSSGKSCSTCSASDCSTCK